MKSLTLKVILKINFFQNVYDLCCDNCNLIAKLAYRAINLILFSYFASSNDRNIENYRLMLLI